MSECKLQSIIRAKRYPKPISLLRVDCAGRGINATAHVE